MKILDAVDRVVVMISVVALVAMMLMTVVSVIGRYFLSMPIPDDLVISEFLMVVVVFLPFAAVQAAREHVFVTIFSDWASNRAKVIMEMIGTVAGFVIFTVIAAAAYTNFHDAWEVGAYVYGQLDLPEAPPKFVVFIGLALFSVRLLFDSVRAVVGLIDGTAVAAKSEEQRALDAELT
jgi:TRAP-type C4-dicarboxylate transport system permease small subunit